MKTNKLLLIEKGYTVEKPLEFSKLQELKLKIKKENK